MSKTNTSSNRAILRKLKGKLPFRLTNAYLFVAVLQENREALCSLIAALLHIKREHIRSIQILNPIVLGQDIDLKECILDLLLLMNDHTRINLEMQVANQGNWDNRSVYYLAMKLVDLAHGENYNDMKPVIQIGILDFNYPRGNQEFYQEIYLMNRKTQKIFSDKAAIHVLCLPQIENATEEDRASGLYRWAKIFRATTWEELKDLSKKNNTMENTVVTIARLSASEKIRQQCLRHEMFEMDRQNAMQTAMQNGYERGHLEGVQQGRSLGADDAFRLLSELSGKLSEADRSSELSRAVVDAAYREKLLAEFGLVSNK